MINHINNDKSDHNIILWQLYHMTGSEKGQRQ